MTLSTMKFIYNINVSKRKITNDQNKKWVRKVQSPVFFGSMDVCYTRLRYEIWNFPYHSYCKLSPKDIKRRKVRDDNGDSFVLPHSDTYMQNEEWTIHLWEFAWRICTRLLNFHKFFSLSEHVLKSSSSSNLRHSECHVILFC